MPSKEQKLIEKYLYRWFQTNEKLVIPELGTLETSHQEANLQPGFNKLSPPNKIFKFEGIGSVQDETFANYIALQEKIPAQQASELINQFVTTLKFDLGIQKRYLLEGFGTFIYNNEGNLDFESLPEVNYEGDSFGLPEVFLKTSSISAQASTVSDSSTHDDISKTKKVESETTTNETATSESTQEEIEAPKKDYIVEDVPEESEKGSRRIFYIAALILLLVTVTFAVLIMTDNNPFGKSFFSISEDLEEELDDADPEDQLDREAGIEDEELANETETSTQDTETEEDNTNTSQNDVPEKQEENVVNINTLPPNPGGGDISKTFKYNPNPPSRPSNVLIKTATSKFFAILGSFDKSGNAYSYYNNLSQRGIPNIKIIVPNGSNSRYRVSYGIHNSKAEADKNGKIFQQRYGMGFWIHKY